LYRSGLTSLLVILVAVLTGRPDLLLLGVPLLVVAVAGVRRRPSDVPVVEVRLGHSSLREGEGTVWRATVRRAGGVEHTAVALTPHRWVAVRPEQGVAGRSVTAPSEEAVLELHVASMRWGHRRVGDGRVATTSAWAAFRCGPVRVPPRMLSTLPLPGRFDSHAPAPHPIGLVGTNPARRPGDGSEFAGIRPFAPGDRLRRVQWRVSLRTGALHVTSTVAEQDSSILLVLDAGIEVGAGGGLNGSPSSLDVGVRAAGAIAEHYLRHGDRVGLRVLGSTALNAVRTGAGQRHLRRVLDTLARVVPGERADVDPAKMSFGASGDSIVIMLSPMLSEQAVTATVTLARRGLDVVVVDTVPENLQADPDDRVAQVAWRLRLLEREALLAKVQHAGIPVVVWRGPGTLDEVLRRLGRRASQPRLVRR
jgi:uncharacterized protein (DUF58 family)